MVDEFAEDYQERRLSRRDALKLIAAITGNLLVANSILAACTPFPEETVVVVRSTVAKSPTETDIPVAAPSTPEQTTPAIHEAGKVMPDDPDIVAGDVQMPIE